MSPTIPVRCSLALALVAIWACSPSSSSTGGANRASKSTPPVADPAADSAAIRTTLDGWYAAMQAVDSSGIVAPLTPQFLLLEDTLPLSATELVARLKQGGTDTKWNATFSAIRTRIVGDVAWTTLKNHETSQAKDGKRCQADFLETIVFVRDGGSWRIDRYHAAALHRWSCAP